MIAAALALALFGPRAAPQPPPVQVVRVRDWRVVKRTDSFTGAVRCTVEARGMAVQGALVVFDLGRDVDTAHALVRLDAGPALGLDAMGLDPLRVSPDVALYNPSGGEVALPLARLGGVRYVWLRAGERAVPRRFDVTGAAGAARAAADAGCGPRL